MRKGGIALLSVLILSAAGGAARAQRSGVPAQPCNDLCRSWMGYDRAETGEPPPPDPPALVDRPRPSRHAATGRLPAHRRTTGWDAVPWRSARASRRGRQEDLATPRAAEKRPDPPIPPVADPAPIPQADARAAREPDDGRATAAPPLFGGVPFAEPWSAIAPGSAEETGGLDSDEVPLPAPVGWTMLTPSLHTALAL